MPWGPREESTSSPAPPPNSPGEDVVSLALPRPPPPVPSHSYLSSFS